MTPIGDIILGGAAVAAAIEALKPKKPKGGKK